jgi:dolichol-phosphate mannosyltransferase
VYNEIDCVEQLYNRITSVLEKMNCTYEFLIVDDGSTDGTLEYITKKTQDNPSLKVVELSRNFGLQAAVTACLKYADGDALILLDGDLQDPPELIPDLIEEWKKGADVVYTVKSSRREFFLKRFLFSMFYGIQNFILKGAIPTQAGNFSLLDRKVVNAVNNLKETNRYFPGLRRWSGFNQVPFYYDRGKRAGGKPKMNLFRLLRLGMDGIFNYTHIPLHFSFLMGFAMLVLAFGLSCNVLYQKFISHKAILGWTSTILIICLIGGVQLISISILGEYIVRIFENSKRRPEFFVREIHSAEIKKGEDTESYVNIH